MLEKQELDDFYHGKHNLVNLEEIISVLSDISNRHVHGIRDNDIWIDGSLVKDNSELRIENIRKGYGQLITRCRYISQTSIKLLEAAGIKGRTIDLISAEKIYPETRHVVLEILYEGKWIHVDLDMGLLFFNKDYLSTLQIVEGLNLGLIKKDHIRRLTLNKRVDSESPGSSPGSSNNHILDILREEDKIIEWYTNLTKTMMINVYFYTPNSDLKGKVRRNFTDSIKGKEIDLSRDSFIELFYSSKTSKTI